MAQGDARVGFSVACGKLKAVEGALRLARRASCDSAILHEAGFQSLAGLGARFRDSGPGRVGVGLGLTWWLQDRFGLDFVWVGSDACVLVGVLCTPPLRDSGVREAQNSKQPMP